MAAVNKLQHTLSVIKFIKTQTDKVILFYSGGKDSIVLLDLLSKHLNVHLCYMYLVDNLEHVEKFIKWAELKYGVTSTKYSHWMLCQYFNDNYFRFHGESVPNISLRDIEDKARIDFDCKWVINGSKQADSLNRKLMLRQLFLQSVDLDNKKAFPLSLWHKQQCLSYITQHRLPTPINYAKQNSSGVDLNKDCLSYLKEKYPSDYKKIIEVFPFAETILL